MSLIFDNITFEGKLILSENTAGGSGGGATTATYLIVGGTGGMSSSSEIGGSSPYYGAGGTGGVSTGTVTLSPNTTYQIKVGQGGLMNPNVYYSYSYNSWCWCYLSYRSYGAGGNGGTSSISATGTYNSGQLPGSVAVQEGNGNNLYAYVNYNPWVTSFNAFYGATWYDPSTVRSFGIEAWVYPRADQPMVFLSSSDQAGYQPWSFGMGDAYARGNTQYGTRKPYFGSWDTRNGLTGQLNYCVWGSEDLPLNKWTHLAGMYNSNTKKISLYVNGKLVGQSSDNVNNTLNGYMSYSQTAYGTLLHVGGSNSIGGGSGINALLNDVRYTVGDIAYTSEFTPPTTRLTATQNTVFLGFQSSTNYFTTPTTGVGFSNPSFLSASDLDPGTDMISSAGGGIGAGGQTTGGASGSPQSAPGGNGWPYGGGAANVTSSITGTPVVYAGGTASGNIGEMFSYPSYSYYRSFAFNDPQWEYTHQKLGSDGNYYADSGLVILAIPTANYTGKTTGSPTIITTGTQTVLTYTQNGTYTA